MNFENIIFKVPDNSDDFNSKIDNLTKFSFFLLTNSSYSELDQEFNINEKIKEIVPVDYLHVIDNLLQRKVYSYRLSIAAKIYLILCTNNDEKMLELHLEYLQFLNFTKDIYYEMLVNKIFEKGWISNEMLKQIW